MNEMILIKGLIAGLFATLIMDIWSIFADKIGFISKPSLAILGRWVCGFSKGKLVHKDIRQSQSFPKESIVGNVCHYVIGLILGILFVVVDKLIMVSPENYLVAALYGLTTSFFAWFIMFPSFGFGVFGSKGDGLLRTSTINHIVFGVSLAIALNAINLI